MTTTRRSTPEACTYCGVGVDDEHAYRRHLHDVHDPAELSAIDKRRYEAYEPRPNAVRKAGQSATETLSTFHYPVDGETMARFAIYGFAASAFIALALGVGL